MTKISKLEPCLYVLKLIMGIFFIFVTLLWIIHIYLYVLIRINGRPVSPFLNNIFDVMFEGKVDFLGTVFFMFFVLYILVATFKGNVKFGMRFFWFTFYPMVKNETFMNSFIFNALMVNIWTISLL